MGNVEKCITEFYKGLVPYNTVVGDFSSVNSKAMYNFL